MEIKIEVPEEKFKDVLQEELNAFSNEELHDICRQGLIACMSNMEMMQELLTDKEKSYYNDGSYKAKQLLSEAAAKIDFSPVFKELQIQITDYIKQNSEKLIKDLLLEVFMNGLSQNIYNSCTFRQNLTQELAGMHCAITEDIDRRLNR